VTGLAVFVALEMLGARASGGRGEPGTEGCIDALGPAVAAGLDGLMDAGRALSAELSAIKADITSLKSLVDLLGALQMNGRVEAAHLAEAGNIVHLLGEFQERQRGPGADRRPRRRRRDRAAPRRADRREP
jgi:hypothetical protein